MFEIHLFAKVTTTNSCVKLGKRSLILKLVETLVTESDFISFRQLQTEVNHDI